MGSRSAALKYKIYLYDSEGVCELSGALQDTEKTSSVVLISLNLFSMTKTILMTGSNDTVILHRIHYSNRDSGSAMIEKPRLAVTYSHVSEM